MLLETLELASKVAVGGAVAGLAVSGALIVIRPLMIRRNESILKRAAVSAIRERGFYSFTHPARSIYVAICATRERQRGLERTISPVARQLPHTIVRYAVWDESGDHKHLWNIVHDSDIVVWIGSPSEFSRASDVSPFRERLSVPTVVLVEVQDEVDLSLAAEVLERIPHLPCAWLTFSGERDLRQKVHDTMSDLMTDVRRETNGRAGSVSTLPTSK